MGNASNNKQAWINKGMDILTKCGCPSELTIDILSKSLNETDETFHNLFNNWTTYKDELLQAWKEINVYTMEKISEGKRGQDPYVKLKRLLTLVFKLSERELIAIRSWSLFDDQVKKYQDKIDHSWIDLLYNLYFTIYGNENRALNKATKAYMSFLGYMQIRHLFKDFNNLKTKALVAEIFDEPLNPDELDLE